MSLPPFAPRRAAVSFVAVVLLVGCTGTPQPGATVTPATVTQVTPSPVVPSPPKLTPGPDGKVEGLYGTRLRVIPPAAAPLTCRPVRAAERRILTVRGNRIDKPAAPAAVDLPEGWALVASWSRHTGSGLYTSALLTDGETYQELPMDGSWRGTHTNAWIAFESGPDALRVALDCIGATLEER